MYRLHIFRSTTLIALLMLVTSLTIQGFAHIRPIEEGAWQTQVDGKTHTAVFVDGYFSHSVYDLPNKRFISTRGGTYTFNGGEFTVTWQYDTERASGSQDASEWVGKTSNFQVNSTSAGFQSNLSGKQSTWTQTDSNQGGLVGVWRITGRKQGEELSNMPLRDRRTLKILTGDRFQWVAINIKTGEFSGTGGGRYTYKDGKYTEFIEFFSRNNDRVGASLSFDGKIQDGNWHHSGLSSAGDPIYEIWGHLEDE